MKELLRGLFLGIALGVIMFLMFSFVTLEYNYTNWSKEARFAYVVITVYFYCFLYYMTKNK